MAGKEFPSILLIYFRASFKISCFLIKKGLDPNKKGKKLQAKNCQHVVSEKNSLLVQKSPIRNIANYSPFTKFLEKSIK
jgi:hypothetical protein